MKINEFNQIVKLISQQHKIKIQEGKSWSSNIKNKTIYYIKSQVNKLPENQIMGLLLHEVAHIRYTTMDDISHENKELLHTILNAIEDISIEHIISKDYTNAEDILEETRKTAIDNLLPKLFTLQTSKHEKALLYGSIKFYGRGYSFEISDYEKVGKQIAEILEQDKQLILNRNKTTELIPIAEKILKLLKDNFGEPERHQKEKMQYEANAHTNADQDTEQTYVEKIKSQSGNQAGEYQNSDIEEIYEITDKADMLGKRLRNIIKINNNMQFGGRFKAGKLLTKRLVKIKTQKDKRPFAKRIIKSNKSYAFIIATDVSGSMFNNGQYSDAQIAASTAHMASLALKKAGIDRAHILFSDRLEQINELNKKQITYEELTKNELGIFNAGTEIPAVLRQARKQLKKSTAEQKIILLITDGNDNMNSIREEENKNKKENIETILFVISGYDSLIHAYKEIYKEENVIQIKSRNFNDLPERFIEVMKNKIKVYEKRTQ